MARAGGGVPGPRGLRAVKWIADRLASVVLLVITAPVQLALAAWVLAEAGRPVLFVQRRVGRGGREFSMLKFRSMVNNAVEIAATVTDDPFGVVKDDPRITRSGRFLRRTGLDELPQLLNVLVGQMSLVGPRPDIPEQVQHYSESDRRRLRVLPGISGWSQVNGRDEIGWPERIAQDNWYIDNWSLGLDLRIAWMTVFEFGRDEPDPLHDDANVERRQMAGADADDA
jgi:lipopolysaccharide/colanic/teichoic acid biosynthesis glycosyltransferase